MIQQVKLCSQDIFFKVHEEVARNKITLKKTQEDP